MTKVKRSIKGAPTSAPSYENQKWQVALLEEWATNIFTETSLPPKNQLGNRIIFYTVVEVTPTRHKVVLAHGFHASKMHIVTPQLALAILRDSSYRALSPADTAILNELLHSLKL